MTFIGPILGIVALLGFGYFIYRKVTAGRVSKNSSGGGGHPDRVNPSKK